MSWKLVLLEYFCQNYNQNLLVAHNKTCSIFSVVRGWRNCLFLENTTLFEETRITTFCSGLVCIMVMQLCAPISTNVVQPGTREFTFRPEKIMSNLWSLFLKTFMCLKVHVDAEWIFQRCCNPGSLDAYLPLKLGPLCLFLLPYLGKPVIYQWAIVWIRPAAFTSLRFARCSIIINFYDKFNPCIINVR